MTVIDDDADVQPRRRLRPGAVVVVALAVGGLVWWAWPTWSGADERLDVLVAGDEALTDAERSIDLRVREEGMALAWSAVEGGWCDADALGEEVDRLDPVHVVVSFADGAADDACVRRTLDALGGRDVVVVLQPGAGPDVATVEAAGATALDPSRLVGVPGTSTLPCEWWEACPPGGVQVRDADGRLTDLGGERLARMVAAAVRG